MKNGGGLQDKGNALVSIEAAYHANCAQEGNVEYVIEEKECVRILSRTIEECDQDAKGPFGKYGGKASKGCGVFTFKVQDMESYECKGRDDLGALKKISPEDGDAAIQNFCGTKEFVSKEVEEKSAWEGGSGLVHIKAYFAPAGGFCKEPKDKYMMDVDECKRKLKGVLDKCKFFAFLHTV